MTSGMTSRGRASRGRDPFTAFCRWTEGEVPAGYAAAAGLVVVAAVGALVFLNTGLGEFFTVPWAGPGG
jgi:hypothetical protein